MRRELKKYIIISTIIIFITIFNIVMLILNICNFNKLNNYYKNIQIEKAE